MENVRSIYIETELKIENYEQQGRSEDERAWLLHPADTSLSMPLPDNLACKSSGRLHIMMRYAK